MTGDEAERLHSIMVRRLDAASPLRAVIELHSPNASSGFPECRGCDPGYWPQGYPDWPCTTIKTLNRWSRIDAIGQA